MTELYDARPLKRFNTLPLFPFFICIFVVIFALVLINALVGLPIFLAEFLLAWAFTMTGEQVSRKVWRAYLYFE